MSLICYLLVYSSIAHHVLGRPAAAPGLGKKKKLEILQSLFDDETDDQETGNPNVKNNINISFGNTKNPADQGKEELSNPYQIQPRIMQPYQSHPIVPNILNPNQPFMANFGYQNPPLVPLQIQPSIPHYPQDSLLPLVPRQEVIHRNIVVQPEFTPLKNTEEDEADALIEKFLPPEPGTDYSKITDLLKQIARDKILGYEKKQKLFDIIFSLIPPGGKISGGITMADIIKVLHEHLEEEEIPIKYKVDLNRNIRKETVSHFPTMKEYSIEEYNDYEEEITESSVHNQTEEEDEEEDEDEDEGYEEAPENSDEGYIEDEDVSNEDVSNEDVDAVAAGGTAIESWEPPNLTEDTTSELIDKQEEIYDNEDEGKDESSSDKEGNNEEDNVSTVKENDSDTDGDYNKGVPPNESDLRKIQNEKSEEPNSVDTGEDEDYEGMGISYEKAEDVEYD